MPGMHRTVLPLLAALCAAATPAGAGGGLNPDNPRDLDILKQPPPYAEDDTPAPPSVIAPYRYVPPPATLSPLERQKAMTYRNQLRQQLLDQQHRLQAGPTDAAAGRRLLETQNELDRMNDVLSR